MLRAIREKVSGKLGVVGTEGLRAQEPGELLESRVGTDVESRVGEPLNSGLSL